MKEQTTAKIYAQSLVELGKENNFDIAKEVTKFNDVINTSNELENLLFLDVFTIEEKLGVFKAISEKLELNKILVSAVNYLIQEKRIGLFPIIYKEIIVIDDHEKGFMRGVIEGAGDSISEAYKAKLVAALKEKTNSDKEPVLEYKKNEDITAGYKITIDDMQLDASVDYQLEQFKQAILEN